MKNLLLVSLFGLLSFQTAQADQVIAAPPGLPYNHHRHHVYPYRPIAPVYPVYPGYVTPYVPVVTCYARGMVNGVVSYGTATNIPAASHIAMTYCQATGQACYFIGCR
jgi:hypothetical protein